MAARGEAAMLRRKERIERARKMAESLAGEPLRKVIGIIAFNLGIREERTREYLRLLKEVGYLSFENGVVNIKKREPTT